MRVFLAAVVLVCGLAAPAEAVSIQDLIHLAKQGISDDILIALVEAEKSVFHIRASDLKPLKEAGLSDRLVVHLIHTASRPVVTVPTQRAIGAPVEAPAPGARQRATAAQVVYVDRVETIEVPVYVPVAVHAPRESRRDDDRPGRVDDDRHERRKPAEPVYWGYGGQLRPDAWKPAPSPGRGGKDKR